jgi:hypothetical protein
MLRNEASIRELFYLSCTADRSFVPQDDRKIEYVIASDSVAISSHTYRICIVRDCFVPRNDIILFVIFRVRVLMDFTTQYDSLSLA